MEPVFYNTSHFTFIKFEDLEDEDLIDITVYGYYNHDVIKIDELLLGIGDIHYKGTFSSYIKVRDIKELEERLEGTGIDFELGYGRFKTEKPKDGYMFLGWGGKPVKKTEDELGPDWVKVTNYKKAGYVKTGGVKSTYYKESPITKESLKDDFLVLNYKEEFIGKEKEIFDEMSFEDGVEYFYGYDIYEIAKGVKEYSGIEEPLIQIEERLERIKRGEN